MTYKLIAIDLDDTLLNTQKTISKGNETIIKRALQQGIKIVLCSGRTHNAVKNYADQLGILGDEQFLITNGGAIIETASQNILYEEALSNQFYRDFVSFVKKNKLHYNVVDDKSNTYTSSEKWFDKYTIAQAYENDSGLFIREPDELPDDFQILKAIINGNKDELDNISDLVHQTYDKDYFVVRTGEGFLEVFPQNVNKGSALKMLTKKLNIDLENVIAIGDRDNDIPMLKLAGKGIAMGNGQPGVKDVADFVTKDNNEDGVGYAIEKFALN
ncbi:Cof-type HAD-IIB family hydrolase [Companilactobacillus zhongbaensis]|uniref:Cof-type HAD-IIB family hydrolase n=1 Tax=Companilactobacillus zhongbaensis TaxID=2486009 RepID=UPI000F79B2CC|nr:Cof-type HAD-IIB family hydrolase [Companilactobacillus zhongbaensis]